MREGAKVYVIEGLEIVEYEIYEEGKYKEKYKVINKEGKIRLLNASMFESSGLIDVTFSKIIAYTTLEERLLQALKRTRKIIRQHRQQFHNTDNFDEFKIVNSSVEITDEELQKEITFTDYNETYSEDLLTDTENE